MPYQLAIASLIVKKDKKSFAAYAGWDY